MAKGTGCGLCLVSFEVGAVVEVDGVGGGGVEEVESYLGVRKGPWVGLGGVEGRLTVFTGGGDDAGEGR